MFNSTNGYSLSDIAAVSGANRNNDGCFGDGNSWWIVLLFLFAFGGWGGNGWGGNGGRTNGEINYGFDINNIKSGIAENGSDIADGFYALNTGLLTGFANSTATIGNGIQAIQSSICDSALTNLQNTQSILNAVSNNSLAALQNTYGLTTQLNAMGANFDKCCCEARYDTARHFADLQYNLAKESCDTRRSITDGVRDLVDTSNANTRQILDFLVQDRITSLTNENATLKNQISQGEQNAYLISQLRPSPSPAYIVSNPYGCNCGTNYSSYNTCGLGFTSGTCCG